MEVIKAEIEGVMIIEPRIFKDARGYFFESFSQRSRLIVRAGTAWGKVGIS